MSSDDEPQRSFGLGLEKLGLVALRVPLLSFLLIVALSALAVVGVMRLKVDDSLSELFRTNTVEFRQYEEIDTRFPSSEYDVLAVIEGPDLLRRRQLEAFTQTAIELQLADGVNGTCQWCRRAADRMREATPPRSCRTSCLKMGRLTTR